MRKKYMGQPTQSDHDSIITLIETVKNNQTTVLNKFDDIQTSIKAVTDTLNPKIADHEVRIRDIERIRDNFVFTWKFLVGISAAVGGLAGWLIGLLVNNLHLFFK